MSYILEALKRSDNERTQGNIPTLGSAQNRRHQAEVRPLVPMVIGMLLTLLFIGLVMLWWNWPHIAAVTGLAGSSDEQTLAGSVSDRQSNNASQSQIAAQPGQQAQPVQATPQVPAVPADVQRQPPPAPPVRTTYAAVPAAAHTQPVSQPAAVPLPPVQPVAQAPTSQPTVEQPIEPQPAVQQPVVQQPADPQPVVQQPVDPQPVVQQPVDPQPAVQQPVVQQPVNPQPVVQQPTPTEQAAAEQATQDQVASDQAEPEQNFKELPADVRRQLPPLNVNVVSYSANEQQRFVMVNQEFFYEGESLSGGVDLDEITPDGLIIQFRGERYLLRP